MRLTGKLRLVARATAFVLAALVMGGCYAHVADVVKPMAEPDSDYYDGYMAGVIFADDAWYEIGRAQKWLEVNKLTSTDYAIQKALLNLPPDIVQNRSAVWVEAFRAGASTRFEQYRVAAKSAGEKTSRWLAAGTLTAVGILVLMSWLDAH